MREPIQGTEGCAGANGKGRGEGVPCPGDWLCWATEGEHGRAQHEGGGSALGDLGAEVDALGAAVHREGLPLGARPFPHHPGHRNHRRRGVRPQGTERHKRERHPLECQGDNLR